MSIRSFQFAPVGKVRFFVYRGSMPCRICRLPKEIAEAIDCELLRPKHDPAHLSLRKIQARWPNYPRSTLDRHRRVCLNRRLLEEARLRKHGRRRLVVLWPFDNTLRIAASETDEGYRIIGPSELREKDAVLGISFKQGRIGNPQALSNTKSVRIRIEREKEKPKPKAELPPDFETLDTLLN